MSDPKYKVGDKFQSVGAEGVYTVAKVATRVVHTYGLHYADNDGQREQTYDIVEDGSFFQRAKLVVPWFEAGKKYRNSAARGVVHVKAAWEAGGRRFAAGHLENTHGVHPWTRDEKLTDTGDESYYSVYTEVTE